MSQICRNAECVLLSCLSTRFWLFLTLFWCDLIWPHLTPNCRHNLANHYYSQFYCSIDSEVAFSPRLRRCSRCRYHRRCRRRHHLCVAVAAVFVLPSPPSLCCHLLLTSLCYVLSTLVLIFRYMSRSIMISSISSSDQLNFIERLESVNRVFRPAWKRSFEVKLSLYKTELLPTTSKS